MATYVMHQDRTSTWLADSANDTWVVAKDAEFSMKNEFGFRDNQFDNTTLRIEGDITIVGQGYSAAVLGGDGSSLVIGADSVIDARKASGALLGTGVALDVVNNGLIRAGDTGLLTSSGATIDNNGEIQATKGIHAIVGAVGDNIVRNRGVIDATDLGIEILGFGGNQSTVTNFKQGEIVSDGIGVDFSGDAVGKLVNKGLIAADMAVQDGGGTAILVNKGKIDGDIDLGAGSDILNLRGGSVKGTVTGGDDDDVYTVSKASMDLVESADGGNDTVNSSAKFTLGDNFETLQLVGNKDVTGRGNGDGNVIIGNLGDNKLFGMDGEDELSGGAGDDMMTGGAAADIFYFASNSGSDVIMDFENNADTIDLTGWDAIGSYADLILSHMTIDGNDIVFQSGNDTLRLKDVDMSELDMSDFVI